MPIKPANINVEGYEMLRKKANLPKSGSSCVIYLPPEWKDKKVLVIKLEE